MSAPEAWADAARRWSEASGLLRSAGRAPVDLRTWLAGAWSGDAADGFDGWGETLERAARRAAVALEEAAEAAAALAAGGGRAGGGAAGPGGLGAGGPGTRVRLGDGVLARVDEGARSVAEVPVPGEPSAAPRPTTPARPPARRLAPDRPATPPANPAPRTRRGRDERVRDWIAEATAVLREHGYRPDQMDPDAIVTIIRHESSGDPSAVNRWDANAARGTPSMGLMQVIGPTFERWQLPGHDRPMDPVDNIIAGVRYAVARYGSVSRVPGVVSLAAGGEYRGY